MPGRFSNTVDVVQRGHRPRGFHGGAPARMPSARDDRRLMARSRLSGGRRRDCNHRSLARGRCPAARRRRGNAHGRGCRKNVENSVERRIGAAQCLLGRLANRRPPVQAGGTTVQDISGRPPRDDAPGRRRSRGAISKRRARKLGNPNSRAKSPCRKRLMAHARPRSRVGSSGARLPLWSESLRIDLAARGDSPQTAGPLARDLTDRSAIESRCSRDLRRLRVSPRSRYGDC